MAYNLYQVQMARAWAQRIEKETAVAEKFWADQAMKATADLREVDRYRSKGPAGSVAGSSVSTACPSGYTSKTTFLKDRLEKLEDELRQEREKRRQVETDLMAVRTALSKPGTPTGSNY